jgi:uncharacterized protein (DUF608 family)
MYAARYGSPLDAARRLAAERESLLARILAWQSVLYNEPSLPVWLRDSLGNNLSVIAETSHWAQARPPLGDWAHPGGAFALDESPRGCPHMACIPCDWYGNLPIVFFFPELELNTLKAIRYFQLRGGQPPFCFGLGFAIRDPRYHCQHTCGAGEYAQMIYRYYLRTGDEQFLKEFWDSARAAIGFMLWLDRDGDGLVEDHPHAIEGESFPGNNPLDCWPWHGPSS